MNHDERHQEECEHVRWFFERDEEERKKNERDLKWLKEQIDAHKRKWNARKIR